TRKCARHRNHVLLCITSADTERVQFHQLAGIVLVQPRPPRSSWQWRHWEVITKYLGLPVVQVKQHCRMPRRCEQHVLEVSKNVRTDGIALITGQQQATGSLAIEHIEMVHPEVNQHFLELTVRINRTVQLVLN